MHWLYIQQLPKYDDFDEWDYITEPLDDDISHHLNILVQAYVLGDRLLIPTFRRIINNIVVDTAPIANEHEIQFVLPAVERAYDNIPSSRIILQFFTDEFCKHWSDEWDDDPKALKQLHPDALVRILRRYNRLNRMTAQEKELDCCYYEHASEQEKDLCERQHSFFDEETDSWNDW